MLRISLGYLNRAILSVNSIQWNGYIAYHHNIHGYPEEICGKEAQKADRHAVAIGTYEDKQTLVIIRSAHN